jgi:hypothetical protein
MLATVQNFPELSLESLHWKGKSKTHHEARQNEEDRDRATGKLHPHFPAG